MNKIEVKSLWVWSMQTGQKITIRTLIIGAIGWVNAQYQHYEVVSLLVLALLFYQLYKLIYAIIDNTLELKDTRYQLEGETVYIKNGGIFTSESRVPLKRVQHVDINQTMYSRFKKLYSVNIYTAGGTKTIEYVKKEEAERIKEKITKYLVETDVESLGKEKG